MIAIIALMKTSSPTAVNTVEAKNNLNALIAQARESRRPIIVEKRGEPVAVIQDYESFREAGGAAVPKTDLYRELSAFHRLLARKRPKKSSDSADLIRSMREQRHSK